MSSFARSKSIGAAVALVASLFSGLSATPARADMLAPIWTGVYAGFHGGATWADVDFANIGSTDTSAFTGGGHAGFNMQFGSLIAGVEGDINYDGGSVGYEIIGGPRASLDVDWNASLRGRIGMPVGPALLYATAGIAWTERTFAETSATGVSSATDHTFTGVVYGLGAETYVMPNLSLRLEALRYDYGSEKLSLGGALNAVQEIDPSDTVVRAGVTFHLN